MQKVGNRTGMGAKGRSGGSAQRPLRRTKGESVTTAARLRSLLGYVPVVLKVVLVAVVAVLAFLGYRAAASASFFQIRTIETRGVGRSSSEAIQATVRSDVSKTGVWRANLSEVSADVERLPWVRRAIVTRVLPDGIRVRITEREPRAVLHTSGGKFIWIDDDAALLDEMKPSDQVPNFFLRGWNDEESTAARTENRERVRKFLELQHDWDSLGLSDRVSEVNLLDTHDVRVQLGGNDSQIEVRLGAQDLGQRLKHALNVLDKQRQTSRGPFISYVDLSQGRRAIVGLVSGSRAVSDATEAGDDSTVDTAARTTNSDSSNANKTVRTAAADKNPKGANKAKLVQPKQR